MALSLIHILPRAARVLERFPAEKLEQFWRKNGLLCRELDEGRLYPYGLQASTVLECLLRRVVQRGGELRCEFPVEEIRREQGFLTLSGPAGQVRARRVILACGGKMCIRDSTTSPPGHIQKVYTPRPPGRCTASL